VAGGALEGDAWAVAGTLAVVLASVFYAGAGIYGQLNVHETPGPVLATGCMLAASIFLLPLALVSPPTSVPTTGAIVSLLLLALFGTALAQLVLFRVVRLYGARRLSLVTYLLPGFALVYGAVILDERVGAPALVGLVLILAGVALGSGTLRSRRRAAATVTSSR
jgi:drug/metabolite transporter (DMT)-like permease